MNTRDWLGIMTLLSIIGVPLWVFRENMIAKWRGQTYKEYLDAKLQHAVNEYHQAEERGTVAHRRSKWIVTAFILAIQLVLFTLVLSLGVNDTTSRTRMPGLVLLVIAMVFNVLNTWWTTRKDLADYVARKPWVDAKVAAAIRRDPNRS